VHESINRDIKWGAPPVTTPCGFFFTITGQPAIEPGVSLEHAKSLENQLYVAHRSQSFTGR